MLIRRLFCLKCGHEAEDNGEYYHCPGCGQYQQITFYEQGGKRPDQRFEWRDIEVKGKQRPEPVQNSGRGMLDVIQPLAIKEQQKRATSTLKGVDMTNGTGKGEKRSETKNGKEQGGNGSMAVYPATVAEDRAQPLRPAEPGECKKRGKAQERATTSVPAIQDTEKGRRARKARSTKGEPTQAEVTPESKPDTNEERPISRAVSSRGEREEPGVEPTAGGISKVAPRRASTTEVQTQDEVKRPDQQQAQPKPRGIGGRPRKNATPLCVRCGVRVKFGKYDVCEPCFKQMQQIGGQIDYERLAKEIVRELYRHLSTKYVTFQVNEGAL